MGGMLLGMGWENWLVGGGVVGVRWGGYGTYGGH
jgi:hypothetical protein